MYGPSHPSSALCLFFVFEEVLYLQFGSCAGLCCGDDHIGVCASLALVPCFPLQPEQEAHGPHRSPEKPAVQINEYTFKQSYDHIYYKSGPVVQEEKIFKFRENTFSNFVIISQCKQVWPFHLNNTHGCLLLSLVEIGPVVFKFCQCIFVILSLSPFGNGRGSSFEQT